MAQMIQVICNGRPKRKVRLRINGSAKAARLIVLAAIRILKAAQADRVAIKPGPKEAALPIQQAVLKNMWRIPIVGILIYTITVDNPVTNSSYLVLTIGNGWSLVKLTKNWSAIFTG